MCKERVADHLQEEISFQDERDQFIACVAALHIPRPIS